MIIMSHPYSRSVDADSVSTQKLNQLLVSKHAGRAVLFKHLAAKRTHRTVKRKTQSSAACAPDRAEHFR